MGKVKLDVRKLQCHFDSINTEVKIDDATTITASARRVRFELGRRLNIEEAIADVRGDGRTTAEYLASGDAAAAAASARPDTAPVTTTAATRPTALRSTTSPKVNRLPPPVLPARRRAEAVQTEQSSDDLDQLEQQQLDRAIRESLLVSDKLDVPSGGESDAASIKSQISTFGDSTDDLQAEIERAAVEEQLTIPDLASSIGIPDPAPQHAEVVSTSSRDGFPYARATTPPPNTPLLSHPVLSWLYHTIRGSPKLTRCLVASFAYLHPVKVERCTINTTGKRITHLLERIATRHEPLEAEVRHLLRKIYAWLELGDLAIIIEDASPRIFTSAAEDDSSRVKIAIDTGAFTAFRMRPGHDDDKTSEVMARLMGASLTIDLPPRLGSLDEHETGDDRVELEYLFRLPGLFNTELLTIGAYFIKAVILQDLIRSAQSEAVRDATIAVNATTGLSMDPPAVDATDSMRNNTAAAAARTANELRERVSAFGNVARGFVKNVRSAPPASAVSRAATEVGEPQRAASPAPPPSGQSASTASSIAKPSRKEALKTFSQQIRQHATSLAKQKGLAWGVRDRELGRMVAKFAAWAGRERAIVGGRLDFVIPRSTAAERQSGGDT